MRFLCNALGFIGAGIILASLPTFLFHWLVGSLFLTGGLLIFLAGLVLRNILIERGTF